MKDTLLYKSLWKAIQNRQLPLELKNDLAKQDLSLRRQISNQPNEEGNSPLFEACNKGLTDIVEYLLKVCQADIKTEGTYSDIDGMVHRNVTPLWIAAVKSHSDVVKLLLSYGADANSRTDSGSTPLRSACALTNIAIVKLLISQGADVNAKNHAGITCLTASVQSKQLSKILLQNGAKTNPTDIDGWTAIHHAIHSGTKDTLKLLLDSGVDPMLENREGDDALQLASIEGQTEIVGLLVSRPDHQYSHDKLASAYDLLGSVNVQKARLDLTSGVDFSDGILSYWKKACDLRRTKSLSKATTMTICQTQEFTTIEDLGFPENQAKFGNLLIHCYLVQNRALGALHLKTLSSLAELCDLYEESSLNQKSTAELRCHELKLLMEKFTVLHGLALRSAKNCLKSLTLSRLDMDQALTITKAFGKNIALAFGWLQPRPRSQHQQEIFDQILSVFLSFINLLIKADAPEDETMMVLEELKHVKTSKEESLLHVACSNLEFGIDMIKLLLKSGANVNTKNLKGETPLHLVVLNSGSICLKVGYSF